MNLYAYVGNDPVNWIDPTGKVIQPVGSPEQIEKINGALKKLKSSNFRTNMRVRRLENSKNVHTIRFPNQGKSPVNKTTGIRENESNGIGTGSETIVDVTQSVTIGDTEYSPESVLAHELLGHGGDKDQGTIDRSINPETGQKVSEENAMKVANEYRKAEKEKLRSQY